MNNVTEEIKARINLVSYIQQSGVPLKKSGNNWKACCPFHSEKTPSFVVNPDRGTWHCFGACGEGGDLFAFAMKKNNWNFTEALDELAKAAGVQLAARGSRKQAAQRTTLLNILETAAVGFHKILLGHPDAQPVREYLQGRGVTPESWDAFRLGWHPGGKHAIVGALQNQGFRIEDIIAAGLAIEDKGQVYDRLPGRLIIPIQDAQGRVVAFAGRRMDGKPEAKYINTPETIIFQRRNIVYGYFQAREQLRDSVTLVEGYMDVIACHQAGHRNVVAGMGTALTDEQIQRLGNVETVIMAMDGDDAGQTAARRILMSIVRFKKDIRVVVLTDGRDPDDMVRDGTWQAALDSAVPVADYLIQDTVQHLPPNANLHQREKAASALVPALVAVESDIIRQANLQALAAALRLPAQPLIDAGYAQLDMPRPPRDLTIISAKQANPMETYCIRAGLRDEGWLPALIRVFRESNLPEFNARDFSVASYRSIWEAIEAAQGQWEQEVVAYVREHVDEVLAAEIDRMDGEAPTEAGFIMAAARVRYERLHAAISMAETSTDDLLRQRELARKLMLRVAVMVYGG